MIMIITNKQAAERTEEERCQAEEKAEKPGRGEDKNYVLVDFDLVTLAFSDNQTAAIGDI